MQAHPASKLRLATRYAPDPTTRMARSGDFDHTNRKRHQVWTNPVPACSPYPPNPSTRVIVCLHRLRQEPLTSIPLGGRELGAWLPGALLDVLGGHVDVLGTTKGWSEATWTCSATTWTCSGPRRGGPRPRGRARRPRGRARRPRGRARRPRGRARRPRERAPDHVCRSPTTWTCS